MGNIFGGGGAGGAPTQAQVISVVGPNEQIASPVTGGTVVMTNDSLDGTLMLTPAGPLATLTITLPTDGASRILQRRSIYTTQSIATVTMNGATTIPNAITTMNASDHYTFEKVAPNVWVLKQ